MELERPEDEPLPGEWKRMTEFDQLLLFRALRPDRLTAAMAKFVTKTIGQQYVSSQPFDLELSFQVISICHVEHFFLISWHWTGFESRCADFRFSISRRRRRRICRGSGAKI